MYDSRLRQWTTLGDTRLFFSDRTHSELVEAQCKKVNDEDVGIWFLRMKSTLNETRNYVNMIAGEEPVPMLCRTAGGANSTISYIHIKSNSYYENAQTIVMDNSTEGGCNNVTNGASRAPQTYNFTDFKSTINTL